MAVGDKVALFSKNMVKPKKKKKDYNYESYETAQIRMTIW